MTPSVIGLSIAYVALGVLLLGLTVGSRWPVWVKVVSILSVSCFYFVTYLSLVGLQGWATTESPPERFLLQALSIEEPNKTTGSKGAIYLWATPLTEGMPGNEPRAYRLEYAEGLHNRLEEANKRLRNGIMQIGRIEKVTPQSSRVVGLLSQKTTKTLRFYDIPDPEMPEK